MIRQILVGDMHAEPSELDDCSRVIELVASVARQNEVREVLFLGDQHHTHAILRLEVLNFWKSAIKLLKSEGLKVAFLVGNHDQAAPGSNVNAMMAYDGVGVIDKPTVREGVLYLPYMHDNQEVVRACDEHGMVENDKGSRELLTKTVVCHQTFDGSRYENGFLASDGLDPNLLPQELIISGHIHSPQEFGKVWYPGAPRWRTLNDANVERAIWLVEFDKGVLVNRKPFSTGEVCRRIYHVEDTPDDPVQLPLDGKHQWRVDVRGPAAWCQSRKLELAAAGARVRTFPDQVSTTGRVRESEGIGKAFRTFLESYQAKHGTPRDTLGSMAKERLNV